MEPSVFWLKPAVREDERLAYSRSMRFETEVCEADPDHAKSQRRSNPLRLVYTGGVMTDFMWTPFGEPLVNRELMYLMQEAKFAGSHFSAVELENTMGDTVVSDLFELVVTGWAGTASQESGIRVLKECPHCKRRVFSGYTNANAIFDPNQWDGSDMFRVWPLPRYIIVTSKVARFCADHQLTGVRTVPLSQLPKPIAGTLSPGAMDDWKHVRATRG